MSDLDSVQEGLIRRLAPGDWVSGAELAEELGLSREAISKRIRRLADWGLEVDSQSGRGYRLSPALQLLDAQALNQALPDAPPITVLSTVDSSNRWLQNGESSAAICLAEHQSAGRGRRGRQWQSPFGQNIYLSLRWSLPAWPEKLPSLSLALGIRLCETLRDLDIPAQLKWPNDLYLNGRKLAGLLIEQTGEANGPCTLIIGLGLNHSMREQEAIDQAWTSLAREGHAIHRQYLTQALIQTLLEEMQSLSSARLNAILQRFSSLDVYAEQMVSIIDGGKTISGQSRGIDEWGRLRLLTDRGEECFSVGDVRLRKGS